MNAKQIAALGSILAQVQAAEPVGLVLIGGVKALISIFHAQPTEEELNQIEVAVVADAEKRKGERSQMIG